MSDSHTLSALTERQQLLGGVVALALAAACVLSLPVLGNGELIVGSGLGLLAVALFVFGTLSIGTSEQVQV
jgi:hypothetical protein